jgi:hypothetical protein
VAASLHHEPGSFQPQSLQGLCWCLASLGQKRAAELTGAEVGDGCDREGVPQISADVRHDQLDTIRFRRHVQKRGMLSLSAHPTLIHDHKLGNDFCDLGAKVPIDHRESKIDSCGHSSRASDPAVFRFI